jgi:tetratricopeptide (TPR) repeat protein
MTQQQLESQLERHLGFLAQDAHNLALLIEISELYQQLNDLTQAQNYLDKASHIDRISCLAHQGLLYLNQNRIDEARATFVEALNHEDTPAIRFHLGYVDFLMHQFDHAIDILRPLLHLPEHIEAQILYARILHVKGGTQDAIDTLSTVLKQQEHADALGLLSLLYFDSNQEELAFTTAKKTLALDAKQYDALIVSILMRLLTQETTIEEIQDLLALQPEDSRLWFALGNTYITQGDLNAAIQSLEEAIALHPDFYDCLVLLAWCHLLQDNIVMAQHCYEKATQHAPDLADAWGGLSLVHALKEDFLKAEQFIDKAHNLNTECFLAEIAETIYYNHKHPLKAKKHFEEAMLGRKNSYSEQLAAVLESLSL